MTTRRKHQKMMREKWGRERVLDERRTQEKKEDSPLSPEEVMWREFTDEVRRRTKGDEVREDEFQPTPRHLIGVETHPVPEFAKSRSYPHQPLEKPSHLWCDEVSASDKDVMRGNQKR